jgi:hypothetical protein
MKKGIVLLSLIFSVLTSVFAAEAFEGSISFLKQTRFNSSYITCYVKDNMVRIEEADKSGKVTKVLLMDTEAESVYIVDTERKLYNKLNTVNKSVDNDEHFLIIKSENTKVVNGILCYQWRVRNNERNTEVAYWVAPYDYDFFDRVVRLLNRTDHDWEYFRYVPDSKGFFPMIAVESNIVRDERVRTTVVQINRKRVDNSLFEIPDNYKPFML